MRVLVTRDRAYIGPVMVPFLIAAGHEVVGLDASGTTAVISVRHRMSTNNELATLGMPRLMILSA
jgi:UDP-glucose 4-epimerase